MKSATLQSIIGREPFKSFCPIAYFDPALDCIRVEIRECSILEKRIDETFTLLKDNHSGAHQSEDIGFMIKGISHLFKTLGLPTSGSIQVADLLDLIVKQLPEAKWEEMHSSKAVAYANDLDLRVEYELPNAA